MARVYPELVVRDRNGKIPSVRYDDLAPMPVNELKAQKHQFEVRLDAQAARIRQLETAREAQSRELQAPVLALKASRRNN